MAFVVRESKRGLGICTALLRALLRTARHRGMSCLYAQVQADNAGRWSVTLDLSIDTSLAERRARTDSRAVATAL